ncbi:MAG TPA: DUF885 family protein, partial [Pyrinomonadaceae bacterium]|nr:DUF885 family protein [Pyrinomonadaceae bacterium]
MRLTKTKALCLSLLAAAALNLSTLPAGAQRRGARESSARPADAAKALHALFEDEWEWRMRESPTLASLLGDRRYNDRWPDVSLENIERRQRHRVEALARLGRIDRAWLSAADQLNYDLFKKDYETAVEEYKFRMFL